MFLLIKTQTYDQNHPCLVSRLPNRSNHSFAISRHDIMAPQGCKIIGPWTQAHVTWPMGPGTRISPYLWTPDLNKNASWRNLACRIWITNTATTFCLHGIDARRSIVLTGGLYPDQATLSWPGWVLLPGSLDRFAWVYFGFLCILAAWGQSEKRHHDNVLACILLFNIYRDIHQP